MSAKSDAFHAGFAIACIALAQDHMEDGLAALLLNGVGITSDTLKDTGLDQADIDAVSKILADNK
jgi:hypothetical protein